MLALFVWHEMLAATAADDDAADDEEEEEGEDAMAEDGLRLLMLVARVTAEW